MTLLCFLLRERELSAKLVQLKRPDAVKHAMVSVFTLYMMCVCTSCMYSVAVML